MHKPSLNGKIMPVLMRSISHTSMIHENKRYFTSGNALFSSKNVNVNLYKLKFCEYLKFESDVSRQYF